MKTTASSLDETGRRYLAIDPELGHPDGAS